MSRLLLAAILLTLTVSACGEPKTEPPPRPTSTPTLAQVTRTPSPGSTVVDALGRSVRVPRQVTRVVALSPSAAEFAVALGLEVIGRTSDTSLPAVASAPEVGSTLSPDFNAIDALDPPLVLADAAFHSGRTRDFDQFPHAVYVIGVAAYDDLLATLLALGRALDREEQAEVEISRIEAATEALLSTVGSRPGPGVLVISGSGRDIYAASEHTYVGSLLKLLGATNAYAEVAEGAPLAGFGVIEITDPGPAIRDATDVILVIPGGQGEPASQIIAAAVAWADSPALTTGRLHELDVNLFLRSPGPGVTEALPILADLLYPGLSPNSARP